MKPFNLERALAGDKVVTRDGREVTQLHLFDCDAHCLAGVFDESLELWTKNGKYYGAGKNTNCDLFMAPKTVKRWVNFYKEYSYSYNSKEEATHAASETAIAIAVPVEFEEGFGIEVNK